MTPLAECIAQLRAHIDLLSRPSGTEQTESLHEEERALEELLRRLEIEELILRRERDTAAASLAHAETVLAEQRRLIESGPHGYIVTTALGIIQHVNAAAVELLNLQGTFLIGKPLASFCERVEDIGVAHCFSSVILSGVSGLACESTHGVERPCVCLRLP